MKNFLKCTLPCKRNSRLVASIVFLFALPAFGQELGQGGEAPESRKAAVALSQLFTVVPDSFAVAVRSAVDSHPRSFAARSALGAADSIVAAGDYRWAPVINSSVRSGKTGDRGATISVRQPIWDGGRIEADHESALAKSRQAGAEFDEVIDDLRSRAALAYLNVARFRELLIFAEKNVGEHLAARASIVAREKGGLGTRSDVVMVESRLRQAQSTVRQIRGELEKAVTTFRSVIGVDPPVDAGDFAFGELPSLEHSQNIAEERSPELRKLRAQVEAARAAARAVMAQASPVLSAQLSRTHYLGSAAYAEYLNTTNGDWRFGFNLEWQGDVGVSQRFRAQSADRQADSLAASAEAALREVREQVAGYWTDVNTASARFSSLRGAADAAAETVVLFRRQFIIGRRSWPEVVNALSDLYQANAQLTDARYAMFVSAARMAVILGAFDGGERQSMTGAAGIQ